MKLSLIIEPRGSTVQSERLRAPIGPRETRKYGGTTPVVLSFRWLLRTCSWRVVSLLLSELFSFVTDRLRFTATAKVAGQLIGACTAAVKEEIPHSDLP